MWMPVYRTDNKEGDACQIGVSQILPNKRYYSGFDMWGEETTTTKIFPATKEGGDYRPGPKSKTHQGVFFAKKK